MFNDDGEEVFMTAEEEKEAMAEAEKIEDKNLITQQFEKIIENYYDIENLNKILLKAIKNEFERPTVYEVEYFIDFVLEQLYKHKTLLQEFKDKLPAGTAKLISLKYEKFKD